MRGHPKGKNTKSPHPLGTTPNKEREVTAMKYNLSHIMTKAWKIFRKFTELSFGECLHRAWLSAKAEEINAKRVEAAKVAAGISEETNTWSRWKELGYEVIHGSKALFGVDLIWGSRGDGATYKARFFGMSQVQAVE